MSDPCDDDRAARRARRWTAAIALVAFALRALVALQYDARHPQAHALLLDEAAYDAWARRIAAGDWLGREVFFQEPLYAYALGVVYRLLGTELLGVRLAQAALGALTCVVVERIGARCVGRIAGRIAALWLALHGPLLLFPSFVLKETALLLVLALLTHALLAAREAKRPIVWGAWIGVLAGLGALLKGNVLVLAPILVAWPLARMRHDARRALRQALATAAALVLTLAPSAWRNHHVAGAWVPTTTQAGSNVYAGNNAQNPYGRASEVDFVRGVPEHEADDWRREAERREGRPLTPSAVSSFWLRETWRSCAADPGLHVAILWNKLRLSLGDEEVPDNHAWSWDRRHVPLLRAPWPGFGLLAAFGIAGAAWVACRGARALSLGIATGAARETALLGALYLATVVLTVTSDRARLPLVTWLAPLAAAALVAFARAWKARRRGELAWLASLVAASALAAFSPALPAGERAEDLDERDFNLAASLATRGELRDARALVAGLVQRHPSHARTLALAAELELGGIRARLGESSAAARAAATAELDELARRLAGLAARTDLGARERFRVERLRGEVELERGGWRAASEAFEAARAFDPDDEGATLGWARAQVELAAASPDPSERGERARRALDALERLEDAASAREPRWLLVRAHAELLAGREARALDDPAERERGAAWLRGALERLRPLAADDRPDAERRAARLLAGRIQLAIGGEGSDAALASAEKHFRAARELGAGADAVLGLAQALVTRAEQHGDAPESAGRVAEARRLAEELRAIDAGHPALRELDERLARLR